MQNLLRRGVVTEATRIDVARTQRISREMPFRLHGLRSQVPTAGRGQAGLWTAQGGQQTAVGQWCVPVARLDQAIELPPERAKLRDLGIDLGEVRVRDLVDIAAGSVGIASGQCEQLANLVEAESQIARPTHKAESLRVCSSVLTIGPRSRARCLRDDTLPLVVTDGFGCDAGPSGELTDGKSCRLQFAASWCSATVHVAPRRRGLTL